MKINKVKNFISATIYKNNAFWEIYFPLQFYMNDNPLFYRGIKGMGLVSCSNLTRPVLLILLDVTRWIKWTATSLYCHYTIIITKFQALNFNSMYFFFDSYVTFIFYCNCHQFYYVQIVLIHVKWNRGAGIKIFWSVNLHSIPNSFLLYCMNTHS